MKKTLKFSADACLYAAAAEPTTKGSRIVPTSSSPPSLPPTTALTHVQPALIVTSPDAAIRRVVSVPVAVHLRKIVR